MEAEAIIPSRRWFILRTSGARTLPLAASFTGAGFDVWMPVQKRVHKLRAGKVGTVERTNPLIPTFVFARAAHLPTLAAILDLPISPQPPFSIFRYMGRVPLLSVGSLERMRLAEARTIPEAKRPPIPVATRVRPTDGPFMGMSGDVEDNAGGYRWSSSAGG